MRARIAVDWDGTIVEDEKFPDQGKFLPGAVEALKSLDRVFDVVIFSTRVAPFAYPSRPDAKDDVPRTKEDVALEIAEMNYMLKEHGLGNLEIWTRPYKPPAFAYIDNRALRFEGDWDAVVKALVTLAADPENHEQLLNLSQDLTYQDGEVDDGPDEEMPMDPYFKIGVSTGVVDTADYTEEEIETAREVNGRYFAGGAYRDEDESKLDYEGFFNPRVLELRAKYMHKHRKQSDGVIRDSDNWQNGMPYEVYMKSAFRHFMEWWTLHREDPDDYDNLVEALCALMFNCEGYLWQLVQEEWEV